MRPGQTWSLAEGLMMREATNNDMDATPFREGQRLTGLVHLAGSGSHRHVLFYAWQTLKCLINHQLFTLLWQ